MRSRRWKPTLPATAVPRVAVWPPLPFSIYAQRVTKKLPFPLEEPSCRLFSRARQGLYRGIKALGLVPGDEILVPAYHHGSEVEALVRDGIVCRFYDVGQHLEPEERDLEALLGPRVRALYLTHVLGFPQNAARWRAWCDERNLLLIEDAAQAWLGSRDGVPIGSYGNLSIFCLYKTFGLPDGAAVVSDVPPRPPRLRNRKGIKQAARRHAAYLAQRQGWISELRNRVGREDDFDLQREFALGDPERAPFVITSLILAKIADPAAQTKRAANYDFLLRRLRRLVPRHFEHLPEGASPFAFPIQSDRKGALLDELDRRGIGALDFWAVPHPCLPEAGFPRAAALRKSIVGLPVHQELNTPELERIVDVVHSALEGSRELT
jgi:dTDP-4-amino-4,6-dideoxygalactose transaminase